MNLEVVYQGGAQQGLPSGLGTIPLWCLLLYSIESQLELLDNTDRQTLSKGSLSH